MVEIPSISQFQWIIFHGLSIANVFSILCLRTMGYTSMQFNLFYYGVLWLPLSWIVGCACGMYNKLYVEFINNNFLNLHYMISLIEVWTSDEWNRFYQMGRTYLTQQLLISTIIVFIMVLQPFMNNWIQSIVIVVLLEQVVSVFVRGWNASEVVAE
jgi:hypothetical protein